MRWHRRKRVTKAQVEHALRSLDRLYDEHPDAMICVVYSDDERAWYEERKRVWAGWRPDVEVLIVDRASL